MHFKLYRSYFSNLEIIVSPLRGFLFVFVFLEIMYENGSTQCLAHGKSSVHCNYYSYQLAPFFIELKSS